MGADEAYLVSAREFGGSDTYATSQILAAAINKIGVEKDDVVMCGRQAIDGDTAQVGPQIAEKLHLPQVTYAANITKEGDTITVQRMLEDGYMTIKEMHMVLHRNLGPFGTTAIGLGEMPLTIENNLGHDKGIETIHAALDAGCRHLDTAWAYYCSGGEEQTGEKLIREAMASWNGPKDEVTIATKVGHFRNFTDGRPTWDVDGRPENLIKRGKESALALGVDTIDLLYFHRPDPKVPYNESVEAIKQLVDEGVAQEAGISNASIEQIDIARGILGDKLIAVQNQYSPIYLDTADTLEYTAKVGLNFVCWSPLGGFRKPKDETKFDPFREIAAARGVSYQQVVLAWELAKGDHVFVIPGAHRPETILDSLHAGDLELTPDELVRL